MIGAVAPVWDGNETWLVVTGVVLWGAFPIVYATLLSAFYLPLLLMLAGLILRGVAFEFRNKTRADAVGLGRLLCRRLVRRHVRAGRDRRRPGRGAADRQWPAILAVTSAGSARSPCFAASAYVSATCCLARAGSSANARPMSATLPTARSPTLSVGLLAFLVVVFAYALAEDLPVIARWLERPYLFVFPVIGAAAAIILAISVRRRQDGPPFFMVAIIFAAAFGTLAISFWPYMIPFSITIAEAAAPHSSLAFMFWGAGLFVFPLMLIYTAISLGVFRGKVTSTAQHY